MKIYLISQNVNNNYDTYSDAVVIAENAIEACKINPNGSGKKYEPDEWGDGWAKFEDVKAEYIGEAADDLKAGTVVCSSFHAG